MRAADLQRATAIVQGVAKCKTALAELEKATAGGLRIPSGDYLHAPAGALPAIKAAVRKELELTLANLGRQAVQIGLVL